MAERRIRPDIHRRFLAIVQAGLESAEREEREHLARLRPRRRLTRAEARREAGRILFRPRSAPAPDPDES